MDRFPAEPWTTPTGILDRFPAESVDHFDRNPQIVPNSMVLGLGLAFSNPRMILKSGSRFQHSVILKSE
jgi:hypothetical protein